MNSSGRASSWLAWLITNVQSAEKKMFRNNATKIERIEVTVKMIPSILLWLSMTFGFWGL